jgi:hypothetical protein
VAEQAVVGVVVVGLYLSAWKSDLVADRDVRGVVLR